MLPCPVHEMGSHAGDFKTPAQNCSVHELGTQSVLLLPISQIGRNIYTVRVWIIAGTLENIETRVCWV